MNQVDARDVDLATDSAVIAGQSYDQARRIALQLVGTRLASAARQLLKSSEYAEGETYHRERESARQLRERARELFRDACLVEEFIHD